MTTGPTKSIEALIEASEERVRFEGPPRSVCGPKDCGKVSSSRNKEVRWRLDDKVSHERLRKFMCL